AARPPWNRRRRAVGGRPPGAWRSKAGAYDRRPPRRRGHGAARIPFPWAQRPDGLSFAEPRRGRAESHWTRVGPRARRHPHRRAARRATARWRAPVLHARIRLRLLQDRRRNISLLATGFAAQGYRGRDPPVSAASDRVDLLGDPARRAWPASGGRPARPRGVRAAQGLE